MMRAVIQVPDPSDLTKAILLPICLDYQQQVQRWLDRYQPLEQMLPDCRPNLDVYQNERPVWTEGWDRINSSSSNFDIGSKAGNSYLHKHLCPAAPYHGGVEPPRWPARPPIRLNQLYWPTGESRWSIGVFLLANTEAQRVLASMAAAEGQNPSLQVLVLLNENDDGTPLSPRRYKPHGYAPYGWGAFYMQLLDLRPISCEGERLWILICTDARYHRNRYAFMQPLTFENAIPTFQDWLSVAYEGDASSLYLGSCPEGTYGFVDWCDLRQWGAASWQRDALAASVGMRVVNDYGWSTSIESPDDADDVLAVNAPEDWPLIAGGEIPNLFSVDPYRFVFSFIQSQEGAAMNGPYNVHVDETGASSVSTDPMLGYNTGLNGQDRHRVHTILSSASAHDEAGNSLSSFCSGLAEALAARFRAWNATRYDYTFAGIMPWLPCGYDDYVLFNIGNQGPPRLSAAADSDGQIHLSESFESMLWTRVVSLPKDFIPTSLSHRSATRSRVGRIAPLIEFTITSGVTGGGGGPGDTDVTVSVTRFYFGEHPDPTLAGLTIKAPNNSNQSKTNQKGFAIRDSQGVWRALSLMPIPNPL